jgi:hypothetical protein
MRSNYLNESMNDMTIIDSWTNNIFNAEFKDKYDYDIFISTDSISNKKTVEYFGIHLINSHITETDTYLINTNNIKKGYIFFDTLIRKIDYNGHVEHISAAYQYYRMYCAYKMMKDHVNRTGKVYDYIVRLRPDSVIMQNIITLFNILETSHIKYVAEHEQLCVFVYELFNVLKLIKYYGMYTDTTNVIHKFLTSDISNDKLLRYAPEKQFVDHVFYTMKTCRYDFFKHTLCLRYPTYNLLYRSDKNYGYMPSNFNITSWKPMDDSNTIATLIKEKHSS